MREAFVHQTDDRVSADVAAELLRSAGIPVRLDSGLSASAELPWLRGQFTLFVPEDRAQEARELLGIKVDRPAESGVPIAMYVVIAVGFGGLIAAIAYLIGVLIGAW